MHELCPRRGEQQLCGRGQLLPVARPCPIRSASRAATGLLFIAQQRVTGLVLTGPQWWPLPRRVNECQHPHGIAFDFVHERIAPMRYQLTGA